MSASLLIVTALAYLSLLFGVAYLAERLSAKGSKLVRNPYTYALSLAVYCTAWTFYGSVGRAASTGIGFLPVYIGPVLMAPLWYVVLRKIIVVSKNQGISSIADFISSRYGKSVFLGGLVTVIAVVGIVPYISLQLKGVALSFEVLKNGGASLAPGWNGTHFYQDNAFFVTVVLAFFTILFGARHLEATRQHQGLVAVIAFESLVKLLAFLLVGIFVTFGVYQGFGDVFSQAADHPRLSRLFEADPGINAPWNWFFITLASMFAVIFLPRQFHISVIENTDLSHLRKAIWLFPLYLLIINLFVLPIAFGGVLHFGEQVDADTYVLDLPLHYGHHILALFVFVGGLAAATGMVIVATIALSVMISNNLVVPLLLRTSIAQDLRVEDVSTRLIGIRRVSIVVVLMLAYAYFRVIGERYTLVSIGLVSFAAVLQFAPAILGGLFWKGGTRAGAIAGLLTGFVIWAYTLPVPYLAESGIFPRSFVEGGPWGISLLHPFHLLGVSQLDPISHSIFWSLLANTAVFLTTSLYTRPSALEHAQSRLFVDIYKYTREGPESRLWRGKAYIQDLRVLLSRFMGKSRSERLLRAYADRHKIDLEKTREADAELVNYVERTLASAIGAASSRLLIASVVKEEQLNLKEVMSILDETQQLVSYSRALEKKSRELEVATHELRLANEQLREMDRVKDEFVTTVTHELRTPMTAIKSLSDILLDKPGMPLAQREEFLRIIAKECKRMTRLINQVLDLEKMESGHNEWNMEEVRMQDIVAQALLGLEAMIEAQHIEVSKKIDPGIPALMADADRLTQVVVNLLSNAIKFCDESKGRIEISLTQQENHLELTIQDNGAGIAHEDQAYIFDKFTQFSDHHRGKPQGSGLGLSISRQIVIHHGGEIRVESEKGKGARFVVSLPLRVKPTAYVR